MILVATSGNSEAAPAPDPAPPPPPFSFGVSSAASGGEKKVPGRKIVKSRRDGGGRGTSGPQAKMQTAADAANCIATALSSAATTSAEKIPPGSRVQICNLPPQMKFFEGKSARVVSHDVDSSGIHTRAHTHTYKHAHTHAHTHTYTHSSGILHAGLTSRNFFVFLFSGECCRILGNPFLAGNVFGVFFYGFLKTKMVLRDYRFHAPDTTGLPWAKCALFSVSCMTNSMCIGGGGS
jgi:hypothetical protein